MKKFNIARNNDKANKLQLRPETIRILTAHELALVAAGNCMNGSGHSNVNPTQFGIC